MSNVLAATYPEQIQAVSLYSGVSAGCFLSSSGGVDQWNSSCANGQVTATADAWGNVARNMYSGYNGTRPKMQLWHGSADATLNPQNYREEIKVSKTPGTQTHAPCPAKGECAHLATRPAVAHKADFGRARSTLGMPPTACESIAQVNSDAGHCSNGRMSLASAKRPLPRSKTTRSQIIRLIIMVRTFKASMRQEWATVYHQI